MSTPPARPTSSAHTIQKKRMLMRKTAVSALVAPLLLTGCLMENSMDMALYFDNQTDQTLYLRRRDQLELKNEYLLIDPNRTTQIPLVGRGDCGDLWVITDKDAKIVKDPGEMCWHDTVTIP